MRSNHITQRRTGTRSGLAPLELVLSLPLLLSVMALIVNFSHAATWKVRSATNSRLAMWRHRPMWRADGDPKPANFWPQGANMGVDAVSRISQVDPIWNQSAIAQPWIKGPAFVAQGGYLGVRDNRVNEMSEGVTNGIANLNMRYPFLPSMGSMSFDVRNTILDNVWQHHTIFKDYTCDNDYRRAKNWWMLEDQPEWAAQKQAYLQADAIMTGNPQRGLMRPLDRDSDLYMNGYHYDFYARMQNFCQNDPDSVRENMIVNPGGLVDRIQGRRSNPHVSGVGETMARTYRRMYQDKLADVEAREQAARDRLGQLQQQLGQSQGQLSQLQSQLTQLQSSVPQNPSQIAQVQSQINQVQGQISQTQTQIDQTQSELQQLANDGALLKKLIQQLTDFINTY